MRIIGLDEWNSMELMPCRQQLILKLTRGCVKLAEQPDAPPELREQLLQMAREWMQAIMEAEDESS
jgi:hypothetical protein